MPKYIVTKLAGVGFEVGKEFETDNLHPSLIQHVRQVSESTASKGPEPDADPEKTEDPAKKPAAKKEQKAAPPAPDPDDDNT